MRNAECDDAITMDISINDYKKLLSAADNLAKIKVSNKCKKNQLTYYNDYMCKSKDEAINFLVEAEKALKT